MKMFFAHPRLAFGGTLKNVKDVEKVANAGITHVINLRREDNPNLQWFDNLWVPFKDDKEPRPRWFFNQILKFAKKALSDPKSKLLVMCHWGMARSPSVVHFLLRAMGMSSKEAGKRIHQARPQAMVVPNYEESGGSFLKTEAAKEASSDYVAPPKVYHGREAMEVFANAVGTAIREAKMDRIQADSEALVESDPQGFIGMQDELLIREAAHKIQGKTHFQGLPISIENKVGSVRKGVDKKTGEPWETKMKNPYGYIRHTEGADGDHLDCFLGPNKKAKYAYVIHTKKSDTDKFDEDKVMLGFDTPEQARRAFLRHYDDPQYYGSMTSIPMSKFKKIAASTFEDPRPLTKETTSGDRINSWVKQASESDRPLLEAKRKKKPILYYARPLQKYGTAAEAGDIEYLKELFPTHRVQALVSCDKRRRGMGYYHKKVEAADMVVIAPFRKNRLTAGVWSEAAHALKNKVPVKMLRRGKFRTIRSVSIKKKGGRNSAGEFGLASTRKKKRKGSN